eukprot:4385535-Prymnesium_polylepis.1
MVTHQTHQTFQTFHTSRRGPDVTSADERRDQTCPDVVRAWCKPRRPRRAQTCPRRAQTCPRRPD